MFLGSGILMYVLSILYLLFGNSILGLAVSFHTHMYVGWLSMYYIECRLTLLVSETCSS